MEINFFFWYIKRKNESDSALNKNKRNKYELNTRAKKCDQKNVCLEFSKEFMWFFFLFCMCMEFV